ncbi:MAG: oxygen-independent coproporphyrinogen III oxidase [Flavobacteriia bacterium]|nr:oxygen-independent coproporphyrinogen III oxidase [Flavobacteriia bacterium]
MESESSLIKKYNIPGPRYTSYPTVPYWESENLSFETWNETISKNLTHFKTNEISLYIHLPYCESLCTFCGCHKRITKNHSLEKPYIQALMNEWDEYNSSFPFKIKELHLGGGTPTFFNPDNISILLEHILKNNKAENIDFSFEAHPNSTLDKHLSTLYQLGFKRLSFGVQDYDPIVQKAIHRFQTFDQVQKVHQNAKEIGYTSISHDLVFGLPKQTLMAIEKTVKNTLLLMPDRVSLYSYAHVPWLKGNGQRGFEDNDIPNDEEKRALYELAKKMFLNAGYIEIGMDHFALEHDSLAIAFKNKSLHRNFMGYTTQNTNMLIGLGASSISDSWFAFSQNEKEVEKYVQMSENKQFDKIKGHLLNEQDLIIRRKILDLMCHFETTLPEDEELKKSIIKKLIPLQEDNLIELKEDNLKVKEKGIPFVRNVCMCFDTYLTKSNDDKPKFSKVI